MNNKLMNNKGFTLIELLAVIVILAILVMVAIPAVTKYLNAARQGVFADNALTAISAVRNDVIMNGFIAESGEQGAYKYEYDINEINKLLEKQLKISPFGAEYSGAKIVVIQKEKYLTNDDGTPKLDASNNKQYTGEYEYLYEMCLYDDDGRGFYLSSEKEINKNNVVLDGISSCEKSVDLITFTFAGRNNSHNEQYSAEKGMTWAEFIDSDYNTNNAFFKHNDWIFYHKDFNTFGLYSDNPTAEIGMSKEIIDNTTYYASNTHVGGSLD